MNYIRQLISFPTQLDDRWTVAKRSDDYNRSKKFTPTLKPSDDQTKQISYRKNHPHINDDNENEDDIFGSNNEDDEDFDLFDSTRKTYVIQEIKQKHPQNHINDGVTSRELELKRKQPQQSWPQHYHVVTPKSNASPPSIAAPAGVSINNSGFQKTNGFVNLSGYTGGDGVRHMLVAEKIEAVYFVKDCFGGMRAVTSP